MCFKNISSFRGVSRMFQLSFVLQFCSCIDLIAATRAEGGLVFLALTKLVLDLYVNLCLCVCNFFKALTWLNYSLLAVVLAPNISILYRAVRQLYSHNHSVQCMCTHSCPCDSPQGSSSSCLFLNI